MQRQRYQPCNEAILRDGDRYFKECTQRSRKARENNKGKRKTKEGKQAAYSRVTRPSLRNRNLGVCIVPSKQRQTNAITGRGGVVNVQANDMRRETKKRL